MILSLSNLFGSLSRAGMVGLAAALIFLLILAGKQNRRSRIIVISSIAVIIAVFIGVDSVFSGGMLNRVKAMVNFEKQDNRSALMVTPAEGDKLSVTAGNDKSYLICREDWFAFLDEDLKEIEPEEAGEEGKYKLPEGKYDGLTFYYVEYHNKPGIHIDYKNLDFNIIRSGDEYKLLTPGKC